VTYPDSLPPLIAFYTVKAGVGVEVRCQFVRKVYVAGWRKSVKDRRGFDGEWEKLSGGQIQSVGEEAPMAGDGLDGLRWGR